MIGWLLRRIERAGLMSQPSMTTPPPPMSTSSISVRPASMGPTFALSFGIRLEDADDGMFGQADGSDWPGMSKRESP
jgi:hypothetical protein